MLAVPACLGMQPCPAAALLCLPACLPPTCPLLSKFPAHLQIVGYDPQRGKALLLYDDGEDEWISLEAEELTWHCQLAGPSGVYPGLGRGAPGQGVAERRYSEEQQLCVQSCWWAGVLVCQSRCSAQQVPQPEPPASHMASPSAGLEPPVGRSAVGWRVCVYWPADQAFYSGEVRWMLVLRHGCRAVCVPCVLLHACSGLLLAPAEHVTCCMLCHHATHFA